MFSLSKKLVLPVTRSKIISEWEKFFIDKKEEDYVSLIIRFPFCYSICNFCKYYHQRLRKRTEIADWLALLAKEMEFFSPLFRDYKLKGFYLCGGTISILTDDEMKCLTEILLRYFHFDEQASFRFLETSIENLSYEKIDLYASLPLKINKIGIGLQSFNSELLRSQGRYVSNKTQAEKLDLIKYAQSRIPMGYVDLIHGLGDLDVQAVIQDIVNIVRFSEVNKLFVYVLNKNHSRFRAKAIMHELAILRDMCAAISDIANNYDLFLHAEDLVLRKKNVELIGSFIAPNPCLFNNSLAFGAMAKSFISPRSFYYINHMVKNSSRYISVPYDFNVVHKNREVLSHLEQKKLIESYLY